ncbi:MAG: tyrosine-type recombinase/integrase [Desulfobacterales bacterium]|nr:tyrosine-type recombinase/integrase [Desulfobacterales bacterium]MBF0396566.1 tyrosine-type recombinase/integrase [Desulfobacterales bacterium]
MGSIYKRGKTYWIKYHHKGKPIRESSESDKKMLASELLKRREGEIAQGKLPSVHFELIKFDDIVRFIIYDYEINNKKSLSDVKRNTNYLKNYFTGKSVNDINSLEIERYIEKRLNDGLSNASINRELASLKRILNLAYQQTPPMIDRIPKIKMLKERNIRVGFFEQDEFLKIRDALPDYLKGVVTFAYKTGWRFGEIISLIWSQIDKIKWTVRLEAGTTKNDESRIIYLDNELVEVFKKQMDLQKKTNAISPFVFPNNKGDGKIDNFRKAWDTAFKKKGIPRKLFHDLRRTAVRNMIRAGVPEVVAMKISGHKTRSVFDRYNIVNEADLKLAAERQEKYLSESLGTNLGTIVNLNKNRKSPRND